MLSRQGGHLVKFEQQQIKVVWNVLDFFNLSYLILRSLDAELLRRVLLEVSNVFNEISAILFLVRSLILKVSVSEVWLTFTVVVHVGRG